MVGSKNGGAGCQSVYTRRCSTHSGVVGRHVSACNPRVSPGVMGVEALQASRMKGVSFGVRIFIGPIGIEN